MPVISTLLLAERQWLFRRGAAYRLSLLEVIIHVLLLTALLFPFLSERFTADWCDIIFPFPVAVCFITASTGHMKKKENRKHPPVMFLLLKGTNITVVFSCIAA